MTIAPTVRPSTLDKYQRDPRAPGFLCTDVGSLDRSACRASVAERALCSGSSTAVSPFTGGCCATGPTWWPEVRAMRRRCGHDEAEAMKRTSSPPQEIEHPWPHAVPSDLGFAFRVIFCRSVPITIKPLPPLTG